MLMRIRSIGIVSLMAAVSLFVGVDSANAKSTDKDKCRTQCKRSNTACAVLSKRGDCKTEVSMMEKGGMCQVVNGKGPITVFCPTDAAYAKLGKAKLEAAQKDPKSVCSYHVVKRKVAKADLKAPGSVATMHGEHLMTNVKGDRAEVDGCLIIEEDIPCSNGIIHIIDEVPIPERGK